MNDPRTQDQKDADDAYREALLTLTAAYGVIPKGHVLRNFITVGSAIGVKEDEDGNEYESELDFTVLPEGGRMTSYRETVGTLRLAALDAEQDYLDEVRGKRREE